MSSFVKGQMTAEAVDATSMAFKKALFERALGATTVVTDEGPLWSRFPDMGYENDLHHRQ